MQVNNAGIIRSIDHQKHLDSDALAASRISADGEGDGVGAQLLNPASSVGQPKS